MNANVLVRTPALLAAICLPLAACGPSHTSETYKPSELQRSGQVASGRIIAVEDVPVSGTSSGLGAIGGGVAGGALGASLASGRTGSILAGVGGAIIGSLAGNAVEQGMTRGRGTRFHVQMDDGSVINVVQTNEANLQTGDRVMVLEGGGKTRLARDETQSPAR
jgi:outer membrane lipoprotein SlyB